MGARVVRYSQAFKRKVVEELESGRLRSQQEARGRYGIGGADTIPRWLRQFGRTELMARVVRVESMEERDQVKELKHRVKVLEKALADAKAGEVINQAYYEIVCERMGIEDPEGLKKRLDGKLFGEGAKAKE